MCDMVPEMYEYWPQKDKTPSDACCAKVLSSDILVCILGAKYGFVRKDSGSSMTEMELKCALQSGKPILIYVLKDYKDEKELYDKLKESDIDLVVLAGYLKMIPKKKNHQIIIIKN